jgi:GT2 family glycosyltransferase
MIESESPEGRCPSPSPQRTMVIPVLDQGLDGQYGIRTLLEDLHAVPGEVVCVFNSRDVFEQLHQHPRIDKFCFNSHNAGVSRAWNQGLGLAEGRCVFFLNADLHVQAAAIEKLEDHLVSLRDAVIAGPQGSLIDFSRMKVLKYFGKGAVRAPIRTHDVSGFFFAVHRKRFQDAGLIFDTRFSPCFFEEWDIGLQAFQAGLSLYTVPVTEYEHQWGISSAPSDTLVHYFGRPLKRGDILKANRKKFMEKWGGVVNFQAGV